MFRVIIIEMHFGGNTGVLYHHQSFHMVLEKAKSLDMWSWFSRVKAIDLFI